VHVHDACRRQHKAVLFVEAREQSAKPVGIGDGVVVEKRDVTTGCGADAGVVATGEPTIAVQGNEADPRKPFTDVRDRAISGSVVDQNGLVVDARLRRDRCQAGIEMLPAVPGDDDDGNGRRGDDEGGGD